MYHVQLNKKTKKEEVVRGIVRSMVDKAMFPVSMGREGGGSVIMPVIS